jgi:hypothetical protein
MSVHVRALNMAYTDVVLVSVVERAMRVGTHRPVESRRAVDSARVPVAGSIDGGHQLRATETVLRVASRVED